MEKYIRGIDISHYNAGIDIPNLPKDIAFVGLKCTQGATNQDPEFQNFYHSFKTNHPEIIRIPYHFFNWDEDGILQGKNALSRGVNFTEPGTGPLMLDLEGDGEIAAYVTRNRVTCLARANDFIAYYKANSGSTELIIYSNDYFIKENLGGAIWPDCIFWLASYQDTLPPKIKGWPYQFWQYSQFGRLDGTGGKNSEYGNYDLDYFLGTQEELNKLANIV